MTTVQTIDVAFIDTGECEEQCPKCDTVSNIRNDGKSNCPECGDKMLPCNDCSSINYDIPDLCRRCPFE